MTSSSFSVIAELSVRDKKRILSSASEAFDISSRRKICSINTSVQSARCAVLQTMCTVMQNYATKYCCIEDSLLKIFHPISQLKKTTQKITCHKMCTITRTFVRDRKLGGHKQSVCGLQHLTCISNNFANNYMKCLLMTYEKTEYVKLETLQTFTDFNCSNNCTQTCSFQ